MPPTSKPLRWGLVGPGQIAQRFAQALQSQPGATLAAVAGRHPGRAHAFARQWGVAGAPVFGDAPALARSGAVDAVYIATPHSEHGAAIAACLQAGLPVLCEKPLVPTAAQARPLIALARARGVLLMEALWTRMLPAWAQVRQWLDEGRIGPLRSMASEFCFELPFDPAHRCYAPALAGGTLLDIGIYNLTMLQWAAGTPVRGFELSGERAPTGVDIAVRGCLQFDAAPGAWDGTGGQDGPDDAPAPVTWPAPQPGAASGSARAPLEGHFSCAFNRQADNVFSITGAHGRIELPLRFWEATRAVLHRAHAVPLQVDAPFRVNGFEYQIEEATRCIALGCVESPAITHASTLATLTLIDAMRGRLGVRYPFEDGAPAG